MTEYRKWPKGRRRRVRAVLKVKAAPAEAPLTPQRVIAPWRLAKPTIPPASAGLSRRKHSPC